MRFLEAVDRYFDDMCNEGRIRSDKTEIAYRQVLLAHAEDINNRDPSLTGREDVKRTLKRWAHPNTRAVRHAALVSFYDWCTVEEIRETNPARQVRRTRKQPTNVYRLTRAEAAAILNAATETGEKRIVYLGVCAGIRNAELRGLQGRHFARPGFVWVSPDIAKRGKERWIPILSELEPICADIRASVALDHYVLPQRSAGGWGPYSFRRENPELAMSTQTVQRIVHTVAKRAGIAAHIHPHLLRHAFADHIARQVSLTQAQRMLGHADIQTTQRYVGEPTLDELAKAIRELRFQDLPAIAFETGRDPSSGEGGIRTLGIRFPSGDGEGFELPDRLKQTVQVYAEHFRRELTGDA